MECVKYRLNVVPQQNRKSSLPRKYSKEKVRRNTSVHSIEQQQQQTNHNKKTKCRLSLSEVDRSICADDQLINRYSLKANQHDRLPISKQIENSNEDQIEQTLQQFKQIEIGEEEEEEDVESSKEMNVKESLMKKEKKSEKMKDESFDLIGIRNYSSRNLTDNDIPMIIEESFNKNGKSCYGIILRDNCLTSKGIEILINCLMKLRQKFRYLSLADNPNLGDESIQHLIRLLETNRSMTFLAIPNTGITDYGFQILANTLSQTNSAPIEKLYISFNQSITDQSLPSILQLIQQNPTLKVLSVRNCHFSNKAQQILKQLSNKIKKRKFSLAQ